MRTLAGLVVITLLLVVESTAQPTSPSSLSPEAKACMDVPFPADFQPDIFIVGEAGEGCVELCPTKASAEALYSQLLQNGMQAAEDYEIHNQGPCRFRPAKFVIDDIVRPYEKGKGGGWVLILAHNGVGVVGYIMFQNIVDRPGT